MGREGERTRETEMEKERGGGETGRERWKKREMDRVKEQVTEGARQREGERKNI